MKNYIGLDAHSQTCTFAVLDSDGNLTDQVTVRTEERSLVNYLKTISGEKILSFEESFMSKWLYAVLRPHVDDLKVCNPAYLFRNTQAKTDKIDSRIIAQNLRAGTVVPIYHVQDNELFELRSAVSGYMDLVSTLISTKNRIKACFLSEAIEVTTGKSFYRDENIVLRLENPASQLKATLLFKHLRTLEESKKCYLQYFEKASRRNEVILALTSIPGIEIIRACIIAAVVVDGRRFKTKHRFWSYCSLVRHSQISDGRSYGTKRIHGHSELKAVFMGAALTVLQLKHSSLKSYYDRLRSTGLDDRKSRKALARKIAAVALSVMKKLRPYEPEPIHSQSYRKRKNELKKFQETS